MITQASKAMKTPVETKVPVQTAKELSLPVSNDKYELYAPITFKNAELTRPSRVKLNRSPRLAARGVAMLSGLIRIRLDRTTREHMKAPTMADDKDAANMEAHSTMMHSK